MSNNKVIIHPELQRRRDELVKMIIANEERTKKVVQFPKNKQ